MLNRRYIDIITPKIPGCIDSSVVTVEQIKNEFLSWLT